MKKLFLFLLLSICSLTILPAQDSSIKNRWNIKAGYSPNFSGLAVRNGIIRTMYGNYRIEANYGVTKFLETGIYLGYSRFTSFRNPISSPEFEYKNLNTPYFGLSWNFHLLPFFVKKPDFPIDLYLLGRYGGAYYTSPEDYIPSRGLHFECSHGVGLSGYFNKHVGLFVEGSFNQLHYSLWNVRGGLTFKF